MRDIYSSGIVALIYKKVELLPIIIILAIIINIKIVKTKTSILIINAGNI